MNHDRMSCFVILFALTYIISGHAHTIFYLHPNKDDQDEMTTLSCLLLTRPRRSQFSYGGSWCRWTHPWAWCFVLGGPLGPIRFAGEKANALFRLICCERKILFRLKKNKLKKTDYKRSEHGPNPIWKHLFRHHNGSMNHSMMIMLVASNAWKKLFSGDRGRTRQVRTQSTLSTP